MSRHVAICQPHYLPWIGYFEMIDRVDLFVLFDDVDFIKREWKNRNRIRKDQTSTETRWLTVPVKRSCQRGTPIHQARLANDLEWSQTHLNAIQQVYRGTTHFAELYPWLEAQLRPPAQTLGELNCRLIVALCEFLGIHTSLVRSSELTNNGRKTDRLLSVLNAVNASHYLANNGSASYLEPQCFTDANIEWRYQDYTHPIYIQRSKNKEVPFLSHLSVIDLLMNHGPQSLEIIRKGRPISPGFHSSPTQ